MTIIGYARVGTDGQTLTAQHHELQAAGAGSVFAETASGASFDRKELARAIKSLRSGDTLLVTRLDRLAHSTRDLLNILDAVAKVLASARPRAVGRHDGPGWPLDADGARRVGRVRPVTDLDEAYFEVC